MRRLLLATIIAAALLSGCGTSDYYTIPWWKGIPASYIAPSSQEAMGWCAQQQQPHECTSVIP